MNLYKNLTEVIPLLTKNEYELKYNSNLENLYKDDSSDIEIVHKKCKGTTITDLINLQVNIKNNKCICEWCNMSIEGDRLSYKIMNENYDKNKSYYPLKLKHLICGTEFEITEEVFNLSLNKNICVCPTCNKGFTHYVVQKKIKNLTNDEYEITNDVIYKNNSTELVFKHNKCGNSFFNRFDSGYESLKIHDNICPFCNNNRSQGERIVENCLNNHNKFYIAEMNFKNNNNVKSFFYDFFLPNDNLIIEFDGKHHFPDCLIFESTHKNDVIKKEFCNKRGYYLLRIPYVEIRNTYEILQDYFCSNDKEEFLTNYYNKRTYYKELNLI